jgi:DNA-binding MarR family transcriptional regulator
LFPQRLVSRYIPLVSTFEASNRHRLHHLVWECNMAMMPLLEETFGDTELTVALAGTLDEIATTPGSTVADISRRSPKTQQAISQAVARLEKLGYVERRLGSGRGVGLYLTASGQAAHADGVAREERIEVRLRGLLGTGVYAGLVSALEQARPRLFHDEPAAQATKASEP